MDEYTAIGSITNTHGIRGELKVFPLTEDIERFNHLKIVYIGEGKIKVNIEKVRYHKNLAIIKFNEFDNINEVLQFKDNYIYIDDKERISLPENHFFVHDLLNSQVFDTNSNLIGSLVDILKGASNDIYVIRDLEKNKEYLIPSIKEFIINIDIEDKKIIIDPIEGMIE